MVWILCAGLAVLTLALSFISEPLAFVACYGAGVLAFGGWMLRDAREREKPGAAWAAAAVVWPLSVPAYLFSSAGAGGALRALAVLAMLPLAMMLAVLPRSIVENQIDATIYQAVTAFKTDNQQALAQAGARARALVRQRPELWGAQFAAVITPGENVSPQARKFLEERQAKPGRPVEQLQDNLLDSVLTGTECDLLHQQAYAASQKSDPDVVDRVAAFGDCADRVDGLRQARPALLTAAGKLDSATHNALAVVKTLDIAADAQAATLRPLRAQARFYREPRVRDAAKTAMKAAGLFAAGRAADAAPLAQQAAAAAPELAGNDLILCMIALDGGRQADAQAACEAGLKYAAADPTLPDPASVTRALHSYRGLSLLGQWKGLSRKQQRSLPGRQLLAQAQGEAAACPGGAAPDQTCQELGVQLSAVAARGGRRR